MSDHVFLQLQNFLLGFLGAILCQLTFLSEVSVFILKSLALCLPFLSLSLVQSSEVFAGVWFLFLFVHGITGGMRVKGCKTLAISMISRGIVVDIHSLEVFLFYDELIEISCALIKSFARIGHDSLGRERRGNGFKLEVGMKHSVVFIVHFIIKMLDSI